MSQNELEIRIAVAIELIATGKISVAKAVLEGTYDPRTARAKWIKYRSGEPITPQGAA